MKTRLPLIAFLVLASAASSIAGSDAVLTHPSRSELMEVIGGMDLSMGQKLSLRSILEDMQQRGAKVLANDSLSSDEKAAQVVQNRQDALAKTQKILNADQQKQLAALLLPKK